MVDISKHPLLKDVYDLMQMIEVFPASDHQTATIIKAGEILDAVETLRYRAEEAEHREELLLSYPTDGEARTCASFIYHGTDRCPHMLYARNGFTSSETPCYKCDEATEIISGYFKHCTARLVNTESELALLAEVAWEHIKIQGEPVRPNGVASFKPTDYYEGGSLLVMLTELRRKPKAGEMTCPHADIKVDGLYKHQGTTIGIAWTCLACGSIGFTLPHLLTPAQREEAERVYRGERERG